MSDETLARWLCLLEGLQYISKHEVDTNNDIFNIKSGALETYIGERFPAMLYDIQCVKKKQQNENRSNTVKYIKTK